MLASYEEDTAPTSAQNSPDPAEPDPYANRPPPLPAATSPAECIEHPATETLRGDVREESAGSNTNDPGRLPSESFPAASPRETPPPSGTRNGADATIAIKPVLRLYEELCEQQAELGGEAGEFCSYVCHNLAQLLEEGGLTPISGVEHFDRLRHKPVTRTAGIAPQDPGWIATTVLPGFSLGKQVLVRARVMLARTPSGADGTNSTPIS